MNKDPAVAGDRSNLIFFHSGYQAPAWQPKKNEMRIKASLRKLRPDRLGL